MKPRIKLAETTTAAGLVMALFEQDGAYSINLRGQELMHSRASASEVRLGEVGVAHLSRDVRARILVGGLGLGFTLQSVLDVMGSFTTVDVAELLPEVVAWNRTHLRVLNGRTLEDPRVSVFVGDVGKLLQKAAPRTYDSILLDLDNGPTAMVAAGNQRLYSETGLRLIKRALKANGRVVFWSAGPDPRFERRLHQLGFSTQAVPAKVHERASRAAYVLYVARVDPVVAPEPVDSKVTAEARPAGRAPRRRR